MRGSDGPLIGRDAERARLVEALEQAALGEGSLVLLAGEAGVGKTRLAEEVARRSGALVLQGAAAHGITVPYGAVVGALRSHLRSEPDGLAGCGSLLPHLSLILPELGEAAASTDRATLFESVRCALAELAHDRSLLVVLDDLQWSDGATLELLGAMAQPLTELSALVIAAYRSDGLPRDHRLRRLRNELRRSRSLNEVSLEPLGASETALLLAELLEDAPSPGLVRAVQDRTQGVPFFVEELARALRASGSLRAGRRGLELGGRDDVPVPETVRDAVRMSASELSDEARMAAEAAAVAGESLDLELVAGLSSSAGLDELVDRGILRETGSGGAEFRHALTREAIYADVPWLRRRELHRLLAEALAARGGSSSELATHWLGAREWPQAREALLDSVDEFRAVHAYRDAAAAARQAVELWPEDGEGERRVEALVRYAECAEPAGELGEAARAWREVSTIRARQGGGLPVAEAERRLAGVYDLTGDRELGFAARQVAADTFAAVRRPADAAVERLAMANHMRHRARHGTAVELARAAASDAAAASRLDLRARAMGLEGLSRAKGGEFEAGLETVRGGLALALEQDLTAVAAELYQRLSVILYDGADYASAEAALETALQLCRTADDAGTEVACVSCMAYVLRERGEWSRAIGVSRELMEAGESVFVAEAMLGSILGFRGKSRPARRMLSACRATAGRIHHYSMLVDSTAALAWVAASEGELDEAADHCRALLAEWARSDDHHYAVWGLRWAAAFLARRGDPRGAQACSEALTQIAADTGHADALAALAHALGEAALHDGEVEVAAEQLTRAVELHGSLEIPFERAQIQLRAGVALAAAGDREVALERLTDAYRAARKLGAAPVASEAAAEVAALGESVERHLGRRAASAAERGGLTRRELQVVRLVAVGRTNKEIAAELFLSPRTVDMHVRNILSKLDCRSRVEAARRADELGVLD